MRASVKELSCVVKEFLDKQWNRKSPLMIAYSGGPDSKALLYAVLEWNQADIQVVHVDHGWREKSKEEVLVLEREVNNLGLVFHTTRLQRSTTEDEARKLRYAYFRSLQERISYQALLLGHQADDLAETVLKRIFEGANLTALMGMQPVSTLEGLELWRPLLSIPRSSIEEWLESKKIGALFDETNHDSKFLRTRLRQELLPFLNKSFGKNISRNLLQLSERSRELRDSLLQKNEHRVVRGSFGFWIDGNALSRVELRALIQKNRSLSRSIVETLLDWVDQKKRNRFLSAASHRVLVDNGYLFFMDK